MASKYSWLTKELLEKDYMKLGSAVAIANKYGMTDKTARRLLKINGIQTKTRYDHKYIVDHDFFSRDNEQSFYIAGFIAADGSLTSAKYSKILKISLAVKDASHLELIKMVLGSDHKTEKYIKKYKTKKGIKWSKCVAVQITSSKLFQDLKRFNIIPNKTATYYMPDWLLNHPLLNHFMRGYFDGDGSFYLDKRNNSLHFKMVGTKIFLEQYKKSLNSLLKLNSNSKIGKTKSIYRLEYSGKEDVKNITNLLYNKATLYLTRKYILAGSLT
jgi:intein/homing endonuclease